MKTANLLLCLAIILLIITSSCTTSNNISNKGATDKYVIDYEYHPATGAEKDTAIIFLSAEMGIPEYNYYDYTQAGYTSYALAYFGSENTPAELDMIPLEYFREAISLFKSKPETEGKKIVIVGHGKGAEAALLIASIYNDIEGVVAYTPSSVAFEGFKVEGNSSWTLDGKALPFVPYIPYEIVGNVYVDFYRNCLTQEDKVKNAVIKVEDINGPILLLSGTGDTIWPASEMGETIISRLEENDFKHDYKHCIYEDGGHSFNPYFDIGGTPEGNKIANEDSKVKIFEFLEENSSKVNKETDSQKDIYINQVGYLPHQEKYFMVDSTSGSFNLVNLDDDVTVYSGELKSWKESDPSSGMNLYVGDFSSFNTEGEYLIELEDGGKSYSFKIGKDIYNSVRNISLKSYYLQRSGMDLLEEHVGRFKRVAGHTEDLDYHKSSPITGSKDVAGGWYDAGDYGRYIISGSVSLGVMMMGYEQFPEKFDFDDNNIKESGNGVSDFLDEMRYELEWMLKMQHLGDDEFYGALPYMVNSRNYVQEMPHVGSQPQMIYDFSSVATADFTAVMALASRLFRSVDSAFAQRCLNASRISWGFLKNRGAYPENGFQRPEDTETGGYAENANDNFVDSDDRLWAAVELFLATGEHEYHNYFKKEIKTYMESSWDMRWTDTIGFAKTQYILGTQNSIDTELQNNLKNQFIENCEKHLENIDNDGFRTTLSPDDYIWGSNSEVLNRAEHLIFAYQLTDDKRYYNGALSQLNYVLGLNGKNMSYVVDFGTFYPRQIHHGITGFDKVSGSFPGLIAGGPNSRLNNDTTLPLYFDETTPPGLCYVDNAYSWAANESCIVYNAPLVPVSAFFSN